MSPKARGTRALESLADQIAVLAVLAAVLALIVPWHSLARRSDLLLAALVLLTALSIVPTRLAQLRDRAGALIALSIGPFIVLTALAWVVGRLFAGATREGILSLGLSSTEVASVGLVALAGGDAVLALGVLTGSLVVSAVFGPLLAGALGQTAAHVNSFALLGRFALVVLVPLAAGLAARGAVPSISRADGALGGLSTLAVCALVFAALSGLGGGDQLPAAALGAVIFLAAAGVVALIAARLLPRLGAAAVGLPTGLRDFAVAAALATQAFGVRAATVAGIYGVLMLIAGALAATALRRRRLGAHAEVHV